MIASPFVALYVSLTRDVSLLQGYVTGDCRAVGDGSYKNVSDGTSSDTVRVTMDAGTDIDCGSTMNQANVARALLD
eukprot:COSAG04_NODE_8690_length_942_cov_1.143535_2_plen_75_part_01